MICFKILADDKEEPYEKMPMYEPDSSFEIQQ